MIAPKKAAGTTFPSLSRVDVPDAIRGRNREGTAYVRASRAVASTLFTTREGPPPEARLDFLCAELADLLTRAGTRARWVYRGCLLAVTVLAPLMILRLPPFRRLRPELQSRALARMERSTAGLAVLAVKAVLCILYYEHPDAACEVGFDGRCLRGEADPP